MDKNLDTDNCILSHPPRHRHIHITQQEPENKELHAKYTETKQ